MPTGAGLSFDTRTGNSSIPDASWSPWAPAAPGPDGSSINSPRGRYIQVRANLKPSPEGKSVVLRSLSVTYLPENRPPAVTISSPTAGVSLHGKIDLQWHGQDPDGDALLYQVAYSEDGGATWKPASLSTTDGKAVDSAITAESYHWDTSALKDGAYLVRVTVSDRRSNPDNAMQAEAVAGPFRVVNREPSFAISPGSVRLEPDGTASFEGTVSGHGSPVVAVSYRIDGGAWFAADPANGIFDSETVSFRVRTDPMSAGKHKIEVEATSASGEKTTSTFDVERVSSNPA